MAFTIFSALRMVLTQTPKNIQTGGVDFTPRQVRSESPGTGKSPNDPWRFEWKNPLLHSDSFVALPS